MMERQQDDISAIENIFGRPQEHGNSNEQMKKAELGETRNMVVPVEQALGGSDKISGSESLLQRMVMKHELIHLVKSSMKMILHPC